MTTFNQLLEQLKKPGYQLMLDGDNIRVRGQLTNDLRAAIRQYKPELLAWLKNPTIEVTPGVVVRLHKTRPDCMSAGYCKQVTHEDCNLFPVTKDGKLSGFCRERVPARGGPQNGRASAVHCR